MKRKRRGKFDIKKEFHNSLKYINESKFYIYAILFLFILSALIAVIFPAPPEIQNQIKNLINEIIKKTEGMNFSQMFLFIFLNNIKSSFIGMISGIFFGIFSIIIGIVNGYFLGFVSAMSVSSSGIFVLWKIFPHGIFELPAIFISLGLGLKMGSFLFKRKKNERFNEMFMKSLKAFFFVVLPLLVVAGIIESALIIFSS